MKRTGFALGSRQKQLTPRSTLLYCKWLVTVTMHWLLVPHIQKWVGSNAD